MKKIGILTIAFLFFFCGMLGSLMLSAPNSALLFAVFFGISVAFWVMQVSAVAYIRQSGGNALFVPTASALSVEEHRALVAKVGEHIIKKVLW